MQFHIDVISDRTLSRIANQSTEERNEYGLINGKITRCLFVSFFHFFFSFNFSFWIWLVDVSHYYYHYDRRFYVKIIIIDIIIMTIMVVTMLLPLHCL